VISQQHKERRDENHGKNYSTQTRFVYQLLHKNPLPTKTLRPDENLQFGRALTCIYLDAAKLEWLQWD